MDAFALCVRPSSDKSGSVRKIAYGGDNSVSEPLRRLHIRVVRFGNLLILGDKQFLEPLSRVVHHSEPPPLVRSEWFYFLLTTGWSLPPPPARARPTSPSRRKHFNGRYRHLGHIEPVLLVGLGVRRGRPETAPYRVAARLRDRNRGHTAQQDEHQLPLLHVHTRHCHCT